MIRNNSYMSDYVGAGKIAHLLTHCQRALKRSLLPSVDL